ncbi:little elongation complex subunit 2, partial [Biomphalaria glabrata]|uniref:Little elongation complex subunit 2-like n=1 Tax=Biomphalaria glabrata TaxID=6526 RepID=A0A9W3B6I8_BIOGL|nr:little elongation complex subunit 2-like [Biomphalaria glabrata]XP_055895168.1 little elongation complex subunit 2-like [Biomphalaria glabrata]KAI8756414.1 little elongation complex subunit 2-like [Biomphalaria glabrata]
MPPKNNKGVTFSEASYLRVVGTPSFEEEFIELVHRTLRLVEGEKEKTLPKHKDLDKPKKTELAAKKNVGSKMEDLHEQVLLRRNSLSRQCKTPRKDSVSDSLSHSRDVQVEKKERNAVAKNLLNVPEEETPNDVTINQNIVETMTPEDVSIDQNTTKAMTPHDVNINQSTIELMTPEVMTPDDQNSTGAITPDVNMDQNTIEAMTPDVNLNEKAIEVSTPTGAHFEQNTSDVQRNEKVSHSIINVSEVVNPDYVNKYQITTESITHQPSEGMSSSDGDFQINQNNSKLVTQPNEAQPNHSQSDDILCLVMPSLSDEESDDDISVSQPTLDYWKGEVSVAGSIQVDPRKSCDLGTTMEPDSTEISDGSIANQPATQVSSLHEISQNETHDFSDQDIPIFSVKKDTPESSPMKQTAAKKNSVWADELEEQSIETTETCLGQLNDAEGFKRSELTVEEHATYLRLYNKYVKPYLYKRPPDIFGQQQIHELSTLESLQRRVVNEQAEFQKYLHKLALKHPQGYRFLKAGARHYASKKACAFRLKKDYETLFQPAAKCNISFRSRSPDAELSFCQTVLEVGVPPRIVLPDIQGGSKPVPIEHAIKKLDYNFPRSSKKLFPGFIHHEPVSSDGNMKALLIKHKIQVAMSSSVVNCLFNNHGPDYAKAWNIPVTVETYQSEGSSHKLIFLDKPLFEDDLLIRDYSTLFHKYALRVFVSQTKIRNSRNIRSIPRLAHNISAPDLSKPYDDTFDIFSSSGDSLETFGTGAVKPLPTSSSPGGMRTRAAEKQKSSTDSSSDEPKSKRAKVETQGRKSKKDAHQRLCPLSPVPDTPSSPLSTPLSPTLSSPSLSPKKQGQRVQEIPLSPVHKGGPHATTNHSPAVSSPKESFSRRQSLRNFAKASNSDMPRIPSVDNGDSLLCPLDSILGQPLKQPMSSSEIPREDPSEYMGPTEDFSSLLYNLFTIGGKKILIRCRSHGVLKDSKKSRQVYLLPKLEYQSNHGFEQTTLKEVVKSWTSCYIRQKTNLLRVRINSFNSEILMYEELEPQQILGGTFNFQPKDGFQFLDTVLNHLMSLGCGKYLLSHEPGKDFCALRCLKPEGNRERQVPEAVSVNKINNDNTVPWIPIDPTLITQTHLAYGRIPATFIPKDFSNSKKKKKNKKNFKKDKDHQGKQQNDKSNGHASRNNKGKTK